MQVSPTIELKPAIASTTVAEFRFDGLRCHGCVSKPNCTQMWKSFISYT
jgi:hypothetical protein